MPKQGDMKEIWNKRAEEDALWYILSDDKFRDIRMFNQAGIMAAAQILSLSEPFLKGRERVLDLACGIGRILQYMARCFKMAYGVDISEVMVAKARIFLERLDNVNLEVIDGEAFPMFRENKFDLIYTMFLYEHFPNKDIGVSLMKEVYRVLKPEGIFNLSIATCETHNPAIDWDGVHWTQQEILDVFKDAGFEVVLNLGNLHENPLITSRVIIGRK
jgi:ubiquinone/menaquinone biosynthesis C-methylase UbiE